MPQMVVRFYNKKEIIKENMIRVHRLLSDGATERIYFDVKFPKPTKTFDQASVTFWNAGSQKPTAIDDLQVEAFDKK
jgi:hypothetical protein